MDQATPHAFINKPTAAATSAASDAARWLQQVAELQDRTAFVNLFNYFAPRIKSYLRRQGLEDGMAEDVTQDVMLQVWNRAGQFDAKRAGASTWIYTIARNRFIDVWRQRKQGAAQEVYDLSLAEDEGYEPQEAVEMAQDQAQLQNAINSLPREQRTLIEDSYFDERSQRMIARARKIPLGTVKSRLRLALDHLRGRLKGRES